MSKRPSGREGAFFCSHCQEYVDNDLLVYLSHTDQHIIDAIKKQFPDWVETDGACPK